jgi:hypothetical protein
LKLKNTNRQGGLFIAETARSLILHILGGLLPRRLLTLACLYLKITPEQSGGLSGYLL